MEQFSKGERSRRDRLVASRKVQLRSLHRPACAADGANGSARSDAGGERLRGEGGDRLYTSGQDGEDRAFEPVGAADPLHARRKHAGEKLDALRIAADSRFSDTASRGNFL